MRYLCFVTCAFAFALPASAQHSFSLPPIGGPLPAIGLPFTRVPAWEVPRTPAWERQQQPPWERGDVAQRPSTPVRHRSRGLQPQIIYVYQPYPVEVQPQVVIVERPVERIVEVEVPVERMVEPLPPREPEPPFVPSGSRVLYVIPGCYVGNVPPNDVRLPASCDLSKLTTFTP